MDLAKTQVPIMDWNSVNLPEVWRRFKQHVEMFSGPLKLKAEEDKCSYIHIWVGEKERDLYNTWTLSDEEKNE